MPRKWKRTTSRGDWLPSNMETALKKVQEGGKIKTIARQYNVPRTTLRNHLSGCLKKNPGSNKLGRDTILSTENEKKLLDHILEFETRGFPLTVFDIRKLTYEFAKANGIPNHFSQVKQMAGPDWWTGFRARHGHLITIRKPQALSIQRAIHLNEPVVNKFFDLLENVMHANNLFGEPARVYNADETGLSLVPGVKNIVGRKGARYSSQITSGEKGQTQTILMAVNAAGDYIPPMVIYKGKRVNPALARDLPPGSIVRYSETGYINSDLFFDWIKHFCLHKKFHSGKTLLVLDGHGSHTRCGKVLEFASSHDVEIVSLPPHTSHYLQPLDKVHFKPLKEHYREAVRIHLRNQPGVGIRRLDFPPLFSKAYSKVSTIQNAVISFRCTGICPLDKHQIPSYAFAPSTTTHRTLSADLFNSETPSNPVFHQEPNADLPPSNLVTCLPSTSSDTAMISDQVENQSESSFSTEKSFEEILSFPKAPSRNKHPRKKMITTGSRVLTSEIYQAELAETAKKVDAALQKKVKVTAQRKKIRLEKTGDNLDNVCGFCEGNSYDDQDEEGWIQCQICERWFHNIHEFDLYLAEHKTEANPSVNELNDTSALGAEERSTQPNSARISDDANNNLASEYANDNLSNLVSQHSQHSGASVDRDRFGAVASPTEVSDDDQTTKDQFLLV